MATAARVVTRIGWHELVAPDVERAEVFYTQLFDWTLRVWRPGVHDYAMVHHAGADHGGFLRQAAEPRWLVYVEVADADATAAQMRQAGGSTVAGPVDLPGVGRYVVLADPEGAELAAIAVEEQGPPPAGVFVRDELLTADPEGAAALYGELFGWTVEDAGRGERVFRRGGGRVAGLVRRPPRAAVSGWLSYVGTGDVDATAARAERLGAVVTVAPAARADGSRAAVLVDPVGAAFGIVEPAG